MEHLRLLIIPDYQPRQMLHYFSIGWLVLLSSQSRFFHNRYCCGILRHA